MIIDQINARYPVAHIRTGSADQWVTLENLDFWLENRRKLCGHRDHVASCETCIDSLNVVELVSDSGAVRVYSRER